MPRSIIPRSLQPVRGSPQDSMQAFDVGGEEIAKGFPGVAAHLRLRPGVRPLQRLTHQTTSRFGNEPRQNVSYRLESVRKPSDRPRSRYAPGIVDPSGVDGNRRIDPQIAEQVGQKTIRFPNEVFEEKHPKSIGSQDRTKSLDMIRIERTTDVRPEPGPASLLPIRLRFDRILEGKGLSTQLPHEQVLGEGPFAGIAKNDHHKWVVQLPHDP